MSWEERKTVKEKIIGSSEDWRLHSPNVTLNIWKSGRLQLLRAGRYEGGKDGILDEGKVCGWPNQEMWIARPMLNY